MFNYMHCDVPYFGLNNWQLESSVGVFASLNVMLLQQWGLLKLRPLIALLAIFQPLWKYKLYPLNHIHICQVSLQLSCGDTCQIWTWYSIEKQCFNSSQKLGKQRIGKNWLSNPHFRSPISLKCRYGVPLGCEITQIYVDENKMAAMP